MQAVDGGTLESSGMNANQWHALMSHLIPPMNGERLSKIVIIPTFSVLQAVDGGTLESGGTH